MLPNQQSVIDTFEKMQGDGWDTSKPLKWGFFFFGSIKDNLKGIFSELSDSDYSVESVHQTDDKQWVLQVSKVEALASDKLHRRNIAFNELAEAYDSLYDGWDVGKCD